MALVLVAGAGLMIRSFRELILTGVGFETAHLTATDIDLPEKRYPDGGTQSRFFPWKTQSQGSSSFVVLPLDNQ